MAAVDSAGIQPSLTDGGDPGVANASAAAGGAPASQGSPQRILRGQSSRNDRGGAGVGELTVRFAADNPPPYSPAIGSLTHLCIKLPGERSDQDIVEDATEIVEAWHEYTEQGPRLAMMPEKSGQSVPLSFVLVIGDKVFPLVACARVAPMSQSSLKGWVCGYSSETSFKNMPGMLCIDPDDADDLFRVVEAPKETIEDVLEW